MKRPAGNPATFDLETVSITLGEWPVAGVDEAGRGPWAGPVVAAAVCLDPDDLPLGLADSKLLDAGSREAAYAAIRKRPKIQVGVGIGDVERIDRDNILHATMWAMGEAVAALGVRPKLVLIDGNRAPRLSIPTRTIISGDRFCLSIAAASIIAKITRDRMMVELAREYPGYGFERHKGYGTPEHAATLTRLGVCPIHRRSFKPVQMALGLVESDRV